MTLKDDIMACMHGFIDIIANDRCISSTHFLGKCQQLTLNPSFPKNSWQGTTCFKASEV